MMKSSASRHVLYNGRRTTTRVSIIILTLTGKSRSNCAARFEYFVNTFLNNKNIKIIRHQVSSIYRCRDYDDELSGTMNVYFYFLLVMILNVYLPNMTKHFLSSFFKRHDKSPTDFIP